MYVFLIRILMSVHLSRNVYPSHPNIGIPVLSTYCSVSRYRDRFHGNGILSALAISLNLCQQTDRNTNGRAGRINNKFKRINLFVAVKKYRGVYTANFCFLLLRWIRYCVERKKTLFGICGGGIWNTSRSHSLVVIWSDLICPLPDS